MSDIPEFRLHGEDDPEVERRIQPQLAFRKITDMTDKERATFLQRLQNARWIGSNSPQILAAIQHLNNSFARNPPGEKLYVRPYERGANGDNDFDRRKDAYGDFKDIFLFGENEDLILRMLTAFAQATIDRRTLALAGKENDADKRQALVKTAFAEFDKLATNLNYLFTHFAINQCVTRGGFVPVQDELVAAQIYTPVLRALSDPRYERLNADLSAMFSDYQNRDYADVITKAHSALQRFLQIQVGEEGKNSQRELGALFKEAQQKGVVSNSPFGDRLITALEGFFPRERATKSTAKPALKEASPRDAKLMMDLVLVYILHCLSA